VRVLPAHKAWFIGLTVAACTLGGPYVLPAGAVADPASVAGREELAPLRGSHEPEVIAGRYIVVLNAPASGEGNPVLEAAVDRAEDAGADVTRQYGDAVNGYAATMTDAELAVTRHDPAVAFIEADRRISIAGTRVAQSWGQDRIDARSGLDGRISTAGDGTGVTVYVIDTGVRATHQAFGGRVSSGYTAIADGRGTDDCNGHGTHVAGTIGSSSYGVAPAVAIVAVRVLGCDGSGTSSGVIAGIDWVSAHHGPAAVANLSLGGSAFTALDTAVAASIASGVTYAVAAGNDNEDACDYSPGRLAQAITVAASTSADTAASFSNHGSCVDLYAPGQAITSTVHTSNSAIATYSGTSMASPHVAGAAALFLQGNPGAAPAEVTAAITSGATTGAVSGVPGNTTANLLHVGPPASAPTPAPSPPPAPAPSPTPSPSPSPSPTPSPSPSPTPTPTPITSPTPTTPPAVPVCGTARIRGTLSGRHPIAADTPYTAGPGTHHGCLSGPPKADFDLYLVRWTGKRWVRVAGGYSAGSQESVSYSGKAGRYQWRVVRVRGAGKFALKITTP
jgi:subtilisin family serine protease